MSTGERPITVCFVGNPNCGKTTLFNAFTGAKLKVANWPGVTVERMEGETSYKGRKIRVIDTPGIYSLTSYTMEELVTRRCIEEDGVDVIVNVVDASSLERNLYLTMQLLELKKPVILALNMMDIIEERGMEIDLHRLPEMLGGIPVVPVSARKRTGLDVLMHAVVHHYEEGPQGVIVRYDREIEDRIQRVEDLLREKYPDLTNLRWHAIKMLEYDKEVLKDHPVELEQIVPRSFEKEIINEKYDYVESVIKECLFNKEEKSHMTDQVDKILTHPILGIPAFFGIMALVFFLTFTVGDFLKGYFEQGLELLSLGVLSGLHSAGASDWVTSLVVDGALAGVGGILTFLPNIFILFLALAFLEDSGYTFSGSKIDRAFSFSKLDRHFSQAQRIVTPIVQPRYSAQAIGNLSVAVSHYRSAVIGLFGSRGNSGESVDLGGFGVADGVTLPPGGYCGSIAPEQMQRQIGESHEEHIARVTALIRQATEAMLVEQMERSRRIREQQTKKRQIKIHR